MTDDVKIEGINISALLRNFDKMRSIIKVQGETIGTLKKDQRICFARIEHLNKELGKKSDDFSNPNMVNDLFGNLKNRPKG